MTGFPARFPSRPSENLVFYMDFSLWNMAKNPSKIPNFRKAVSEIEPEIQSSSIYEFNILNKQSYIVLDHIFKAYV